MKQAQQNASLAPGRKSIESSQSQLFMIKISKINKELINKFKMEASGTPG